MINRQEEISNLRQSLSDKQKKRLKPESLANLNQKLLDIEDVEINKEFLITYQLLQEISKGSTELEKDYKHAFSALKKTVRNKYGFIQKGTLQAEFMAMGIAVGIALGAAFISIYPGLIAIGLPLGLAIGLSVGQKKENDANKEGKLY